jgi:hypothetical protein
VLLIKGGFVAVAWAGLAFGLAWCVRSQARSWPVTGALLFGSEQPADLDDEDAIDLRFRAFVAGVLAVVVGALAFPELVRGASMGRLVLTLLLVLPLVTIALAAIADVAARLLARRAVRIEATPDDGDADDEATGPLLDLVEEARLEVQQASARVTDPNLQAALDALRETLDEHAVAAREGEDAPEVRARVLGVTALARTCAEAEGHEAVRLLGVRPDAGGDEVAAVCRALLPIYSGPAALTGVDPSRGAALEAAAARLSRRAA